MTIWAVGEQMQREEVRLKCKVIHLQMQWRPTFCQQKGQQLEGLHG